VEARSKKWERTKKKNLLRAPFFWLTEKIEILIIAVRVCARRRCDFIDMPVTAAASRNAYKRDAGETLFWRRGPEHREAVCGVRQHPGASPPMAQRMQLVAWLIMSLLKY
jgi:hypothetical protein